MADRPIQQDDDNEVEVPTPVWVGPSRRITKEQLAAAERTRDYHIRKLQTMIARGERTTDAAARGER